jgi:hypothetical protein
MNDLFRARVRRDDDLLGMFFGTWWVVQDGFGDVAKFRSHRQAMEWARAYTHAVRKNRERADA